MVITTSFLDGHGSSITLVSEVKALSWWASFAMTDAIQCPAAFRRKCPDNIIDDKWMHSLLWDRGCSSRCIMLI